MYKEHLLITQNNFVTIDHKVFDKLFDSLITNMPVKIRGKKKNTVINYTIITIIKKNELDNTKKNEVNCIKNMISAIHVTNQTTITNNNIEKDKEIKGKYVSIKLKYNNTSFSSN